MDGCGWAARQLNKESSKPKATKPKATTISVGTKEDFVLLQFVALSNLLDCINCIINSICHKHSSMQLGGSRASREQGGRAARMTEILDFEYPALGLIHSSWLINWWILWKTVGLFYLGSPAGPKALLPTFADAKDLERQPSYRDS